MRQFIPICLDIMIFICHKLTNKTLFKKMSKGQLNELGGEDSKILNKK